MKFLIVVPFSGFPALRYHRCAVEFQLTRRVREFGPRFKSIEQAADYLRSVKPRRKQ